jgi:hypothetical protein
MLIWPAPMDADYCFAQAGFRDFADSDEKWDADWTQLVERAVMRLQLIGAPCIRQGTEAYEIVEPRSLARRLLALLLPETRPTKRVRLSLTGQVVLVAEDDQFGEVIAEFGKPPRAVIWAGGGHRALWIEWTPDAILDRDEFLRIVADGRPVHETALKCDML